MVSPVRETDADRRIRKLEELVAGQKCEIAQLRGTVVNSGLQQVAGGTNVGDTYGGTIFGSASPCQPAPQALCFSALALLAHRPAGRAHP